MLKIKRDSAINKAKHKKGNIMFKAFRKNIVSAVAAFTLLAVPMLAPAAVSAATVNNCLASGSNLTLSSGADCGNSSTDTGATNINKIITQIVNIFSAVVGVVSVIMIIFGGFKYITSNGDSGNVSSAKNTIIYAVIGLVIVAMAQFIVQFVLNKIAPTGA